MKLPKSFIVLILIFLVILIAQNYVINKEAKTTTNNAIYETTQAANLTVTKLFINELYPKLSTILNLENNKNIKVGLKGKDLVIVDNAIRSFMINTDILKVKIFSLNGITLYSTEHSQIGEDKKENPAFKSAKHGTPASQITHRGKFSAIDKEVFNRDLVSSYLPIYNKSGRIIGVSEIYTDRTPAIKKSENSQSTLFAYLLLFQIVTFILILFISWNLWTTKTEIALDKEI